jgi:hypothetical protein
MPAVTDDELRDLVGAEVLEVQVGSRFLTGIEALAELLDGPDDPPDGHLATLSSRAIVYAESLGIDDQAVVADRMYGFGRVAIRPSWRGEDHRDALGATVDRAMPPGLAGDARWMGFRHRPWRAYRRRNTPVRSGTPTLKLYISPTTDCLTAAVAASVPLCMDAVDVLGWKVASTVGTTVRPDKFVVYVESWQGLQDLVGELRPVLAGCAVHGVPFTCDLGPGGLFSWGVDPPSSPDADVSLVDSWRTWVTSRLAGGLVQARRAGLVGAQARSAALRRARAAGVDTSTWRPTPGLLEAFGADVT